MRLAQIRSMDISNGLGVGVSLFTQGCLFHCKGCHNPEQWNLNGGQEYTKETEEKILQLLDRPYIKRLSILGGEPLLGKNLNELDKLLQKVPKDKEVWLYTGYTLEELKNSNVATVEELEAVFKRVEILRKVDYLVDGRFEEDKKDITLAFRGSSNQRIWKRRDGWISYGTSIKTYMMSIAPMFLDVTAEFDENN